MATNTTTCKTVFQKMAIINVKTCNRLVMFKGRLTNAALLKTEKGYASYIDLSVITTLKSRFLLQKYLFRYFYSFLFYKMFIFCFYLG